MTKPNDLNDVPMTQPFDGWREFDALDFAEQTTPYVLLCDVSGEVITEEDINTALERLSA